MRSQTAESNLQHFRLNFFASYFISYIKRIVIHTVLKSRLPKMHAKALTCFNFFNFRPFSTKFPINIKNVILTNRMVFVFRIATFLAGK